MSDADPLLSARGLSKNFPGVTALDKVDFALSRGEVCALMGENGAGKSTLIKLLTGVYHKDEGRIFLEGREIGPRSPVDAQRLGISTVYQEVNLIPALSVAENIALGRQPARLGCIQWKKVARNAERALSRLDIRIDVQQPLGSYSIAIQQMVAIARALDLSAAVLILDEPTSSLDAAEVARLFAVMRRLKEQGLGIIFITHFIDQVYQISDRIAVLRNGRMMGNFAAASLSRVELIAAMLGKELRELENTSLRKNGAAPDAENKPFITIRNMGKKGACEPFDLDIRKGEILGLAGLLGSGRTELARLLFGIDRADQGNVTVDGNPCAIHSPRQSIALGFGFCPENRKEAGCIDELTVRENIVLALQAKKGWLHTLSRATQQEIADGYIKALSIATPDSEQKIKNLSGGNQQKAIIARWLAADPRFLILDEPTRGIDVGAKVEIQKLILSLSEKGMSILFISAELAEVVRCSHRIAVMRDRVKIGELRGDAINEQKIMQAIAMQKTDTE